MASPYSTSQVTNTVASGNAKIDPLLTETKWAGPTGSGATVTYSFPWINGASAWFGAPDGGAYSDENEPSATIHFGLNTTQQEAAKFALQAWANVANLTFTQSADNATTVGDIRFAFSSNVPEGFWGWATYPNNYWPQGGDIWIHADYGADLEWAPGDYNFEALLHEIGHALGLKHPFEDPPLLANSLDDRLHTVMSYTNPSNDLFINVTQYPNGTVSWEEVRINPETPMLLDIAAIQYLYGPNYAYNADDTTYTFNPSNPFFKTIWDGGGNDTISLSNFTTPCRVDLNAGNFSDITTALSDSTAGYDWLTPPSTPTYDAKNNLAIAYNCIIENAIGGSGNDTLIGNEVGNRLDGGYGDDILRGNKGDDWFDWDESSRQGDDTFYGGQGNDIYVLDSPLDTVIEYEDEGLDTIWTPFSFSIAGLKNIEILRGFGEPQSLDLKGNEKNNIIKGAKSNDVLDGGLGIDTAEFSGTRSNYVLHIVDANVQVQDNSGLDGNDQLLNIERVIFRDKKLAIDITGNALKTMQFIGVIDPSLKDGLSLRGAALSYFDQDRSLSEACQLALDAGWIPTAKTDLIKAVYKNVIGSTVDPDQATIDVLSPYVDQLGSAGFLAAVAALNINVDLVGLQQNGMEYI